MDPSIAEATHEEWGDNQEGYQEPMSEICGATSFTRTDSVCLILYF